MWLPVSRGFFPIGEPLVGREESSPISRIGKIWAVRCHHVDPKKKSVGQFSEHFLRVFETDGCAIANVEVVRQPAESVPHQNQVAVFVEAVSNSRVLVQRLGGIPQML